MSNSVLLDKSKTPALDVIKLKVETHAYLFIGLLSAPLFLNDSSVTLFPQNDKVMSFLQTLIFAFQDDFLQKILAKPQGSAYNYRIIFWS